MNKFVVAISSLLISACQTSSPVVQAGKDTYMVSSHVAGCTSCSASIQGLKTANEYCVRQGKYMTIRNTRSTTNKFGYEVGNELIFSCVNEADPENVRPSLRKDNGILTIERK